MAKATNATVEKIKSLSQKVVVRGICSISAADDEVGNMIADAMEKVSNDGVITVEESKTV